MCRELALVSLVTGDSTDRVGHAVWLVRRALQHGLMQLKRHLQYVLIGAAEGDCRGRSRREWHCLLPGPPR